MGPQEHVTKKSNNARLESIDLTSNNFVQLRQVTG